MHKFKPSIFNGSEFWRAIISRRVFFENRWNLKSIYLIGTPRVTHYVCLIEGLTHSTTQSTNKHETPFFFTSPNWPDSRDVGWFSLAGNFAEVCADVLCSEWSVFNLKIHKLIVFSRRFLKKEPKFVSKINPLFSAQSEIHHTSCPVHWLPLSHWTSDRTGTFVSIPWWRAEDVDFPYKHSTIKQIVCLQSKKKR